MRLLRGIVFLVLFWNVQAFAQPYRALLSHYNEWHVTNCNNGCLTDVYYTFKDTVVGNYTYQILDGYHYISHNFLLREDTTERRIYMFIVDTSSVKGGEEYLVYDFGMSIGDSVEIHNPISPYPFHPGFFRLDSINQQTLYDGLDYNFFYLTALDPVQALETNTVWVEGIGSLSLINTPGAAPDINNAGQLSCFFYDLTLHHENLDSISGCIQVHTDLSADEYEDQALTAYPNPFTDYIVLSEMPHGAYFSISNLSGQIVKEGKLSYNIISDLDFLPDGFYILKLQTDQGMKSVRIQK